jgi:HPt (histidine-containing phosphotransfer) domain-containing protein
LDAAVIAELRDSVAGDDAFVRDLVATYLDEGPGYIAAMEAAVAAGDAAAIVRPAHTLKSSSASLGAMRLAQLCREIEFAGRDGSLEGIAERVAEARAAWDATVEALQAAGLA